MIKEVKEISKQFLYARQTIKPIGVEEEKLINDKLLLERAKFYIGLADEEYLRYINKVRRVKHWFDCKELLNSQLEILQKYYKSLTGSVIKIKAGTLFNRVQYLAYFASYIKKDFNKVIKEDIQNYVSYMRERNTA